MVSIATGATWKFSYDNHNQLTAANYYSSDAGTLLAWVSYKTDALGHLKKHSGSLLIVFPDADNRLTTQTDPLNHSSSFAYNAVGELTSETDNNGRRDDFTYDALGDKLTENWYNNAGTYLQTQTFTYDAVGQMLVTERPNLGRRERPSN
jgi:YD repeat-containing protein